MKKKFLASYILFLLFITLIILVKTVNVASVGAGGTSIGLSSFNEAMHSLTGVNLFWYDLTDRLGLFAVAVAAFFGCIGLFQWIKRKNIWKVDVEILTLGVLYILAIALYFFFQFAVVNYRPVLMPDATEPEASFPSSHTVLLCTVFGSALMLIPRYIKKKGIRLAALVLSAAVLLLTVFGRAVSGVHWATDILGGLLISGSLLFLYSGVLDISDKKKEDGGKKESAQSGKA